MTAPLAVDGVGRLYVADGNKLLRATNATSGWEHFFGKALSTELSDGLAAEVAMPTIRSILTDDKHVEILGQGVLVYLIHGAAVVSYLNFIRDLLLASGNYEATTLAQGVSAAVRARTMVQNMEAMQLARRASKTGEANEGALGKILRRQIMKFAGNLELMQQWYGTMDISLSALTEVESEKIFSMIYYLADNNFGTVTLTPAQFCRGFGRAASMLLATNAAADTVFNLQYSIRSNRVYKSVCRRRPHVIMHIKPPSYKLAPADRTAARKAAELVRKLFFVYEQRSRVRSTSRANMNHELPRRRAVQLDEDTIMVLGLENEEEQEGGAEDDEAENHGAMLVKYQVR